MRIVFTSVLKPVSDPRLLARLGRALAELPGAEVHIVAHAAADAPTARPDTERPNVWLHPIFRFPRLSLARALAGRTLTAKLAELRPDILVIGTAELLPAGLRWHRATGKPLVYDVRENYALNIRTQGVFPPLVAPLLAARIERLEKKAAPYLAGALLAERVYAEQLPWLRHCAQVEIIENKYQTVNTIFTTLSSQINPFHRPLRLLLSGTLSELYGTFAVIDEVAEMRTAGCLPVELWIVGYAPRTADAHRLHHLAAATPWLRLTAIDRHVPHTEIIAAIRQADVGLLAYLPHPSLDGCIPTKLWEYLGERLPTLRRLPSGKWLMVDPASLHLAFSSGNALAPIPASQTNSSNPTPQTSDSTYGQSRVARVMFTEASAFDLSHGTSLPDALTKMLHSVGAERPPAPPEAFWATEAPRLLAFFRAILLA